MATKNCLPDDRRKGKQRSSVKGRTSIAVEGQRPREGNRTEGLQRGEETQRKDATGLQEEETKDPEEGTPGGRRREEDSNEREYTLR